MRIAKSKNRSNRISFFMTLIKLFHRKKSSISFKRISLRNEFETLEIPFSCEKVSLLP